MFSCCKDEISILCFEAAGACSGSLKELGVYPRKESNGRELSLTTENIVMMKSNSSLGLKKAELGPIDGFYRKTRF